MRINYRVIMYIMGINWFYFLYFLSDEEYEVSGFHSLFLYKKTHANHVHDDETHGTHALYLVAPLVAQMYCEEKGNIRLLFVHQNL